jgi:hypothetical protein
MELTAYTTVISRMGQELAEMFLSQEPDLCERARLLDADMATLTREIGREAMRQLYTTLTDQEVGRWHAEGLTIHRHPSIQFHVIFGTITLASPYLWKPGTSAKPLRDALEITHHGRSEAVNRALSDFGSEVSFDKAASRFAEHYHYALPRSTVDRVTKDVAQDALEFLDYRLAEAAEHGCPPSTAPDNVDTLLIELDGCNARTGTFQLVWPDATIEDMIREPTAASRVPAAASPADVIALEPPVTRPVPRPQPPAASIVRESVVPTRAFPQETVTANAAIQKVRSTSSDTDTDQPLMGPPQRKKQIAWKEVRIGLARPLTDVHKLYVGRVSPGYFKVAQDLERAALLAGLHDDTEVLAVADGGNGLREALERQFAAWTFQFILDHRHLTDHLYATAEAVTIGLSERPAWVRAKLELLNEGAIHAVMDELSTLFQETGEHCVEQLMQYLERFCDAIHYDEFRALGFPIGSGEIESAHKSVPQHRLKLPGACWHPDSLDPMLGLRLVRANDWWDDFWEDRTARKYAA